MDANDLARYERTHKRTVTVVSTWADGFGNWHARVKIQGISPVSAQDLRRMQRAARKAILSEIETRQSAPVGNVRVERDFITARTCDIVAYFDEKPGR